jgi:transmembrane sensor
MKSETSDREEYCPPTSPTLEEEASDTFVQRLSGDWTPENQLALESRLQRDLAYENAYRRVEESWSLLDELAGTPAGLIHREEASRVARQVSVPRRLTIRPSAGRHWRLAAVFIGVALLGVTVWQLSPHGYRPSQPRPNPYRQYLTGIGEQRTVELADHSRIVLDAATRIRVRLAGDGRFVQLEAGQAEFYVVKDPARPFKVQIDGATITDLGTVFNVNRTERRVDIAVIEGRVAFTPRPVDTVSRGVVHGPASPSATTIPLRNEGAIELSAGEELRVSLNGLTKLIPHADLDSLTAWRKGLLIIRDEPLGQAVRRFNRYSSLQIEIQGDALAAEHIGGVFKAGDTQGFIRAIQLYQPVTADYSHRGTVLLKSASPTPR